MKTQRKKQVEAINQMLRQQGKSMSRLKLFDQGVFDQFPAPKVIQTQKTKKYVAKQNQQGPNPQSNASNQTKPFYNKQLQQTSQLLVPDADEIYKINLSPISRLTLRTKNQIPKPPSGRAKISVSQQQLSKISLNKQLSLNVAQSRFIPSSISRQNLSDVPSSKVQKYFRAHPQLFKTHKSPEQVYRMLRPLLDSLKYKITVPLIKQYTNCTYFGEIYQQNSRHQGFLIFQTQKKVFYGEMLNDKKNGKGIEIDFASNAVYKGQFDNGRKKGTFQVLKPTQKYIGQLVNDKYAGFGKLFTNVSIYNGYFQSGLRHGQGQQLFPQTGLKISGTFLRNQFTNSQQKLQNSRAQTKNLQKQMSKLSPFQSTDNPEQSFKHSRVQNYRYNCQEYNYELGGRQVIAFKEKKVQSRSKKKSGFILKRKRSIEEEQPLPKIIL